MCFHSTFMDRAIKLANQNVLRGRGGPFGAVVVKDNAVIATGVNRVTSERDPTAHAEMVAIRAACKKLQSFQLTGCSVYCSCEPCPMCLAALYWARPDLIYYANTHEEAAEIGFDDSLIYAEIPKRPQDRKLKMIHVPDASALESFRLWRENSARVHY